MIGTRHTSRSLTTAGIAIVALVLAGCGGDEEPSESGDDTAAAGDGSGDGSGEEAAQDFTVGMAEGGHGVDWMEGQGTVAQALAEARGWDYYQLSNEGDGPTALENADLFIQEGIDVLLTFSGDASVNPTIAQKLDAAGIPVVTYDINQDGWYFVGIDNEAAGRLGGEALGQLASDEWGCDVDLVVRAEATQVQPVNGWRVDGMLEGLRSMCDIPDDIVVSVETEGLLETALPNGRDTLAAHPEAENILVIGINDSSVVGILQAAEQLNRDSNIMGWGQDGSLITGDDVNPNLRGSVFYFLEGYPTYAFEGVVDKLAAGEDVPVKDQPDDPAVSVEPCLVSAEQAADIPPMEERIAQLIEAPDGTHMNDLFCPAE